MTDNEIIQALECCSKDESDCENCPANGICDNDSYCVTGAILELINRQKAEIERLNLENLQMVASIKNLKAEAIKEFAERLKKETEIVSGGDYGFTFEIKEDDIDNLVKEMESGSE